jgi:transcriptional regulator with XRE-family HTH domain
MVRMAGKRDPERGKRYKAARQAYADRIGRKVTIQDVAVKLGLNAGTVSRWETGKTAPNDPVAVAELYGSSPSFLEFGIGDAAPPDPPWPAWRDFLAAERPEPWQIFSLRTFVFPKGKVPTVETYKRMLFGLKSAEEVDE